MVGTKPSTTRINGYVNHQTTCSLTALLLQSCNELSTAIQDVFFSIVTNVHGYIPRCCCDGSICYFKTAFHCVPIVESTSSHVRYKLWVADMLMCVAHACLRRDQRNAFDTHCTPPGDHQRNDRIKDVVSLTKM